MKILMVLTSHDQLGNTGRKTGFWLEEFAAPYFVFRDAGAQLTLASPKGGQPPIDPKSDLPENQTDAMTRFKNDRAAQTALSRTVKLADMRSEDFDTIFYVGGHGPMWDLADNPDSIALIECSLRSVQSCLNTESRHPLNPLAPPGRGVEGIREILCLVHDLTVAELHNAHCVCGAPLVGDGVFRDPEFTLSENSLDVETRRLARMVTPQGLQIASSEDSFP
jgi:hypothetical protein